MKLEKRLFDLKFAYLYSPNTYLVKTGILDNKALKILLIEDNITDANQIGKMLKEHCCQPDIQHVQKIENAVAKLNQDSFDVVLLNMALADSRGINSLEMVQQKAPQLPTIILTTAYNANLAVKSLRSGAQDYLIKSELTGEILSRSIQYAIERQRIEFDERQQALMKMMVDKIRNSIDLETVLKTTVQEIQQFLDTEQVLIYRCESDRLEDISVVSSSLDKKSAQYTVAQFISVVDLHSLKSLKSQSIRVKAVADTRTIALQKYSAASQKLARSYLSLPIYVGEPKEYTHHNLTHPIIQQDDIQKPSEEIWGMLIAYNTSTPRKWQDWEIGFLQKLTTQVTIAIQQSQLWCRLQTANEKLQQLAILDGLSGISNRRYFDLVLSNEWKRLMREQQPLSLIFCDVDYFKAYNDSYGHQQGDLCLQQIATILQKHSRRSTDFVARYGGEEFAIILPNTDAEGALFIANNIQQKLAQRKLPHRQSMVSKYVTCSMGISTIVPNPQQSTVNLIESADKLLYQAKKLGRNQIAFNNQPSYQKFSVQ